MFTGIYRDSAGVFCNICRENPVIFTDLQNLQGKSVYITGFSLQILQKNPAESLQFPANICCVAMYIFASIRNSFKKYKVVYL